MKDLKYLFAYTVPIAVYVSFISNGIWTFSAIFYVFLILPVLDILTGETTENMAPEEASYKKNKWIFDLMLYLNAPIVFGLLFMVLSKIQNNSYETFELIGLILSAGILLATNGINVAHELGHRKSFFDRFVSQLLYMPCLYMHFYIEHNFGHHLKVATPEDGATAKYNQNLYSFWFSSVTRQYISAWKIQIQKLKSESFSFFSFKSSISFISLSKQDNNMKHRKNNM